MKIVIAVVAIIFGLVFMEASAVPTNDDVETMIPNQDEDIDQFDGQEQLDNSQKPDEIPILEMDCTNDGQEEQDDNRNSDNLKDGFVVSCSKTSAHTLLPLYRYHHHGNADHLYTTNIKEINTAVPGTVGNHGYRAQGIAAILSTRKTDCHSVPLYRYWNGHIKDHFYVANFDEIGVSRHGWVLEGIEGYCFDKEVPGTRPFYRYWNGRDHYYTVDPSVIGTIRPGVRGKYGYIAEGVVCYVYY